jgi:hypothetical protein
MRDNLSVLGYGNADASEEEFRNNGRGSVGAVGRRSWPCP